MPTNNGTVTKEEAQAAAEGPAIVLTMPVHVPAALAATLRQFIATKRQADRDFDVAHQTTCAALGLDPVEWRAVSVDDSGAVTLGRAG